MLAGTLGLLLIISLGTGCFFSKASLAPVLLIDVNEDTDQNRIRPLNPETLIEIAGKAALKIGNKQFSAISDDGSKAAIVSWSKAHSTEAELLLLDVKKWKLEKTGQKIKNAISRLTFSHDGDSLFWIEVVSSETINKQIPKNYKLSSYNIKNKKRRDLQKFESLFIPDRIHLTDDGAHIVVYGLNIKEDRMAKGSPTLVTINTKTGKVVSDIRLKGIKAGLSKVESSKKGEPAYRSNKPGLTSYNEESLMYIAHSDDDKVTVVDMLKGKILKKLDIKDKITLKDGVLSIFEERAVALPKESNAKTTGATKTTEADNESSVLPSEKRAALSSDGTRLYLVGYSYKDKKKKGKTERVLETNGLKILDADDMSEIASFDLPVNNIKISPDDRWLLLKHTYGLGAKKKENGGFYIFDTQRQEKVAYLQKKWNVKVEGFSADSRFAYTGFTEGSLGGHNWKKILKVVDLNSQKLVAKREVKGFVGDLFIPQKTAD